MKFIFPDVGEGIHEAKIVNLTKKVGDTVKKMKLSVKSKPISQLSKYHLQKQVRLQSLNFKLVTPFTLVTYWLS